MFNLTIDLGGTHTKIGLMRDGAVLAYCTADSNSDRGLAPLLPVIKSKVEGLMSGIGADPALMDGVGIAFPGIVDNADGKVVSTNAKFDDAREADLRGWALEAWNSCNFYIDNDSRLATIGEWRYGAAHGFDDVVMMTIGTGIGTGVIIGGEPLYGAHYTAGCLGGHMTVDYRGRRCTCGNIGCVEAYASTYFLSNIIAEHAFRSRGFIEDPGMHNFKSIFELADAGNEDAVAVRDECMDVWSAAIVSYIHAYDPAVVIVGGGVMNSKHVILPYVRRRVGELAWCPGHTVQVEASELEDHAALYGLDHCLNGRK